MKKKISERKEFYWIVFKDTRGRKEAWNDVGNYTEKIRKTHMKNEKFSCRLRGRKNDKKGR